MNDENLLHIGDFFTEINDDYLVPLPDEIISKLNLLNVHNLNVKVYIDSSKLKDETVSKMKIFDKIKIIQSLPDEIVKRFINSKGKFSIDEFAEN